MQSRLLLDVVVGQGAAILELLAGEDEALLVGRNSLLVLDFSFHIIDGVGALNLKRDGLARQGLDEDLHGSQRRSAPPPGNNDEEERLLAILYVGFVTLSLGLGFALQHDD